ncbi:glycosyltransferase [Streptomyces sp. NPDC049577]|uniref:glycosyltransferase n=1 Tax=Streptomyces sp. NPDC049577 TaxID=3155153 RepID=UPI003428024C
MKALLYCYGSRGDVEPYLALAFALREAGHEAVLAAPALFAPAAERHGVPFAPLNDEVPRMMTGPEFREALMRSDEMTEADRRRRREVFLDLFPRVYPVLLREMWDAASGGADIVVHSHNHREVVPQIAEKLGVPHVLASLYPNFVPSAEYPLWERGVQQGKPAGDGPDVFTSLPQQALAAWRSDVLGLPPREGAGDYLTRPDGTPATVLHGFSPHLIEPAADWPETVHTTGYWTLPAAGDWTPPAGLTRFLDACEEAGEKPVFIGFGSSMAPDPLAAGRLVRDAVRAAGVRAVVVAGWGGIEIPDPGEDILTVREVPYDWLLPRMRAAVHAGGVGAHNAALLAGIPQVSVAFHKEQQMWARYLHAAGVTPPPLRQRDLTTEALTDALRQAVSDPALARAADRIGALVRTEDGARTAVRVLERVHSDHSGKTHADHHA